MTIEQIQRHLAVAAEDGPVPPTRVTVAEVYRAGVRRRRVRRWFSFAIVTVTAAGVTGGVTAIVGHQLISAPPPPGGMPDSTVPTPAPTSGSGSPPQESSPQEPSPQVVASAFRCAQLADEVAASLRSVLPELRWGKPRLPEGQETADCGSSGLFWLTFTYGGEDRELGFEGGSGFTDRGCDPERRPVRCEQFAGGEVGHLARGDEYGVLLRRDRGGVFFFLGISDGGTDQPLSTDQLSAAAQRIATDVFG
jgi:hypothetical protein